MGQAVVFCFFKKADFLEGGGEASRIVQAMDQAGHEVHLFSPLDADTLPPSRIMGLICEDSDRRGNGAAYVFLTDSPGFCRLAYRLYHETFSAFALFDHGNAPYDPATRAERVLMESDFLPEEALWKPIFAENSKQGGFPENPAPLGDLFPFMERLPLAERPGTATKIYRVDGRHYIYEPRPGATVCIEPAGGAESVGAKKASAGVIAGASAARGGAKARRRGERSEIRARGAAGGRPALPLLPTPASLPLPASLPPPDIRNTLLAVPIDEGLFMELSNHLKSIQEYPQYYFRHSEAVDAAVGRIASWAAGAPEPRRNGCLQYLALMSESYDSVYAKLFVLSALLNMSAGGAEKTCYIKAILRAALSEPQLDAAERYFIYFQCVRAGFVDAAVGDGEMGMLSRALYRKIYETFKGALKADLAFIPKEARDEKAAVVMTTQMLSLNHAPTKTALDRSASLMRRLGMSVLIVNTGEMLTAHGRAPFYGTIVGSVLLELAHETKFAYGGLDIPFYNAEGPMPDIKGIRKILDIVKKKRPYFILSIGGNSLTADLMSNIAPTVCISTVPSGLACTEGQFQVIGRKKSQADAKYLQKWGFSEGHVIESQFTWNFKPQATQLARQALGLPEGRFLLLVVGTRLGDEMTAAFLEMLLGTVEEAGTFIVFAGTFGQYGELCAADARLRANSAFLGMQQDMLAVCEVCDLYVNPLRAGGGSSVAEAMFKGLPAVTLAHGDVAVGAGPDFCVESYEAMRAQIARYAADRGFYAEMSQKAKSRAAEIMDTDSALAEIVRAVVASPLFR